MRKRLLGILTQRTFDRSRRAIRREHPGMSEIEVRLRFVAIHYGEDLARRVAKALADRGRIAREGR